MLPTAVAGVVYAAAVSLCAVVFGPTTAAVVSVSSDVTVADSIPIDGPHESRSARLAAACSGVPVNHFVRHWSSCSHYIHCNEPGRPHTIGSCPGQTHFDAPLEACASNAVDCSMCSPFGVQHMAATDATGSDADMYYVRCAHGQRTRLNCDYGYAFDTTLGRCSARRAAAATTDDNEQQPTNSILMGPSSQTAYEQFCAGLPMHTSATLGDANDCSTQVYGPNGEPIY